VLLREGRKRKTATPGRRRAPPFSFNTRGREEEIPGCMRVGQGLLAGIVAVASGRRRMPPL
jgi:hypothetical protein